MNIFSIFTLLGGLAFFLYGMSVMSGSLEKMSGGKLEKKLKEMTSNPVKSMLFGAAVTVAIQSSSALTVMLVGLVNSGIMTLQQSVGVLMGSNVGTTLTAWILSLAGIQSDNFFLMLLKPSNFAPLAAFAGILMIMTSKKESMQDKGRMLLGFAILMFGMNMMSESCAPLAEMPQFTQMLTMFNNPILGVIVGTVFTGLIQSSAASVGILQALSLTGGISFRMAIPIIMGQNIGTCVTALISSIGVNKNARRVTVVHIAFNLIGTIIGLVLFFGLDIFVHFEFLDQAISPIMIAVAHSIFNIATTILLLPFTKQLVMIAQHVIADDDKEEVYAFLDERLLHSPTVALEESFLLTQDMFQIAQDSIHEASALINDYQKEGMLKIKENEDKLDMYEDKLDSFLARLSGQDVVDSDARMIFKLLHTISDVERLGDHSYNISHLMKSMNDKKICFSKEAQNELSILLRAIDEIVDITLRSFSHNDLLLAKEVEPLEEVIDRLVSKMKKSHILRLQKGECTVELGYILSDILNNLERVGDHCSNIALSILEADAGESFDAHQYVNQLKNHEDPEFDERFDYYKTKYTF